MPVSIAIRTELGVNTLVRNRRDSGILGRCEVCSEIRLHCSEIALVVAMSGDSVLDDAMCIFDEGLESSLTEISLENLANVVMIDSCHSRTRPN
ncbi:hypothetical protein [Natronoglomus mannanivorans]|uniref:Uncharacterized protein n=1 Tax=Natronoglomus mannanivorans TaxID=2979990 RepID=A0AAP3E4L9_9EURY|nr:hypothetical protein [Halobacteria archaeon AArc-xg1-1]